MAQKVKSLLKQITYTNMSDFVSALNQNFAIIQNSPLFRGIPGNPGAAAEPGKAGKRGSMLIFIDFSKLQTAFGNELSIDSRLTIEWFNSVLNNNKRIQMFCNACNITELSANDTFVLPNTALFQYDSIQNRFIDTGKSLNMYRDILTNLNKQIEEYIQKQLGNIQTPGQQQSGVFKAFTTGGINYENGSASVDMLLDDTLLFPTSFGTKNQINKTEIDALHHSFAGYAGSEITQLLGDARRIHNLILGTVKHGSDSNSVRTINKDSLPALIISQITNDAGILIGSRNAQTLRDFAEIYVDMPIGQQVTDLVFQSNRYPNSDSNLKQFFSQLRINNARMLFTKNLEIQGNSELKGNLQLGGLIDSNVLRTGSKAVTTSEQRSKRTEIGYSDFSGYLEFLDKTIRFRNYLNGVLSTDATGLLTVKPIDNTELHSNDTRTDITWNPSNLNSVVLARQLKPILDQFNKLQSYANTLLTKASLETGIPNIKITENLNFVDKNNTGIVRVSFNQDSANFFYPVKFGDKTTFSRLLNKVLVTGSTGELLENYAIEDIPAQMSKGVFKHSDNKYRLVTSHHLSWVVDNLGGVVDQLGNGVWTKEDFNNCYVDLLGGRKLKLVGTDASIDTPYLKQSVQGGSVFLQILGKVKLNNYTGNRVLTTNVNSEIVDDYGILGSVAIPNSLTIDPTAAPDTAFLTGTHFRQLLELLRNYSTTIARDFWTKADMRNPAHVVDAVRSKILTFSNYIQFNSTNSQFPEFAMNQNQLKMNTPNIQMGGNIRMGNQLSAISDTYRAVLTLGTVVSSEKTGDLHYTTNDPETYYLEDNAIITEQDGTVIDPDKYVDVSDTTKVTELVKSPKGSIKWGTDGIINGLLTKKIGSVIFKMLDSIRKRLNRTPTVEQTTQMLYDHMPVGSVIIWTYESSIMAGLYAEATLNTDSNVPGSPKSDVIKIPYLPKGWVPCDGEVYEVISTKIYDRREFQTPKLSGKFLMMPDIEEDRITRIHGKMVSLQMNDTRLNSSVDNFNTFGFKNLLSFLTPRYKCFWFDLNEQNPNLYDNKHREVVVGKMVDQLHRRNNEHVYWSQPDDGLKLTENNLPHITLRSTLITGFEHQHHISADDRQSEYSEKRQKTLGRKYRLDDWYNDNGFVILMEGSHQYGYDNGAVQSNAFLNINWTPYRYNNRLNGSAANTRMLTDPGTGIFQLQVANGRLLRTTSFDIYEGTGYKPFIEVSNKGKDTLDRNFGIHQVNVPYPPHYEMMYIIKIDNRPTEIYKKSKEEFDLLDSIAVYAKRQFIQGEK